MYTVLSELNIVLSCYRIIIKTSMLYVKSSVYIHYYNPKDVHAVL